MSEGWGVQAEPAVWGGAGGTAEVVLWGVVTPKIPPTLLLANPSPSWPSGLLIAMAPPTLQQRPLQGEPFCSLAMVSPSQGEACSHQGMLSHTMA